MLLFSTLRNWFDNLLALERFNSSGIYSAAPVVSTNNISRLVIVTATNKLTRGSFVFFLYFLLFLSSLYSSRFMRIATQTL